MAFQWTEKIEGVDIQTAADVNLLAQGIIEVEQKTIANETSAKSAQATAESAKQTAAAVSGQLADMNVAIQGNTNDILQSNIKMSQAEERILQNEVDIKVLQESGGSSGITPDELYSLAYYGDINIKPSDSSLFEFTTDDTTMTASVKAKATGISGDIVIPYEYISGSLVYKVVRLDSEAFRDCLDLTGVVMPNTVTNIGFAAFRDCRSLTNIKISQGIQSIDDRTFYNCLALESVEIPEGLTAIGDYAFAYCQKLIGFVIPNSVTHIGTGAFFECIKLADIYFKGTKEQWDSITVDFNNESLVNATILYDWQELFVVTCREEYTDTTNGFGTTIYPRTVDKSIEEILTAINQGKSIRAVMFKDGSDYFLSSTTYATMQRTYVEFNWDEGDNIEVPYDSVSFSFREPDSTIVYEWIFTIQTSLMNGVWEVKETDLASKEYVDDAVAEAKPLIVTITGSDIAGYSGNYSYSDVQTAHQAGRDILVEFQDKIYHLQEHTEYDFKFYSFDYDDKSIKGFGCLVNGWMSIGDFKLASKDYIEEYVNETILGGAW